MSSLPQSVDNISTCEALAAYVSLHVHLQQASSHGWCATSALGHEIPRRLRGSSALALSACCPLCGASGFTEASDVILVIRSEPPDQAHQSPRPIAGCLMQVSGKGMRESYNEQAAVDTSKGGHFGRAHSRHSSSSSDGQSGGRASFSAASPGASMPSTPARDFERRTYHSNPHAPSPRQRHHHGSESSSGANLLPTRHGHQAGRHDPLTDPHSMTSHAQASQPFHAHAMHLQQHAQQQQQQQAAWGQNGIGPQSFQHINMQLPQGPPTDMPPAFHCTLCGVSTASAKNYWAHVQGRAHARRAVKAGEHLPPSYSPMISAHLHPPVPPLLNPMRALAPPLAPHPAMYQQQPRMMPGMRPPPRLPMQRGPVGHMQGPMGTHLDSQRGMQQPVLDHMPGPPVGHMQGPVGTHLEGFGGMQQAHPQPLWPGGPLPPPNLPQQHPLSLRPPPLQPTPSQSMAPPHKPLGPLEGAPTGLTIGLPTGGPVPRDARGEPASHGRYRCEVCDIYTTSAELLESHLGGRKHLRRLVTLAEQRGEMLAPSILMAARW